jgi:hypothetical protein
MDSETCLVEEENDVQRGGYKSKQVSEFMP